MSKVSVVIPVYNVSDYLRKSIESVLAQEFEGLEVVLVDDGSTDDSSSICQEYASKYSLIKLITKQNGGLSDARNAGVASANGKYIYFLDADDWLAPDAISTLYTYAEEHSCDIVQGGFYYAYKTYLLVANSVKKPKVLSRYEAMKALMKNETIKNFAWGKLYKCELVAKHPFPVGKYFEDCYWQHQIIHECDSYGIIPISLYYYRQRENGISGTFSSRNLDLLKGYEERIQFISKEYPTLLEPLVKLFWSTAYAFYQKAQSYSNEDLKIIYRTYWVKMNERYKLIFNQYLEKEPLYRLVVSDSRYIRVYQLYLRIYNRLFTTSLKRIDLPC